MKLRNKKTGYIATADRVWVDDTNENIVIDVDGELHRYYTLDALKQEWEDYEEPKEYYWFIDDAGIVSIDKILCSEINMRKSIGNYFQTEEEAEKAVEKLKAWKRLKHTGFKFKGLSFEPSKDFGSIFFEITKDKYKTYYDCVEFEDDLNLLFGDEK